MTSSGTNKTNAIWQWEASEQIFIPVIETSELLFMNSKLLSGFNVFTTLKWPLPIRLLEAHHNRLRQNAQSVGFADVLPSLYDLKNSIEAILKSVNKPITVRLTIAGDAFNTSDTTPRLILSTRPLSQSNNKALSLKSLRFQKAFPHIKHGGLMEGWLIKQQAIAEGFDDALWINYQGHLTECTTANIFFITQSGELVTPDVELAGCLPGIQRQQVIDYAKNLEIPVFFKAFSLESIITGIDGCFITNAVRGLRLVEKIDQCRLPWTSKAYKLFECLQTKCNNDDD